MLVKRKMKTRKTRVKGTVKWFDTTKGIGFIETEEGNDIFVNYTELPIKNGRFITLQADQYVVFDIAEGGRGPQATNIEVLK